MRGAQHIQDIFRLTHQLKIIYSKMDQQYINILHAPTIRQSFKQQIEIIYKLEMNTTAHFGKE